MIEVKQLSHNPETTYHLLTEIGGGSEGSVYKAVAVENGKESVVAFKEFHNAPDDQQLRHLEREMQLRQTLTDVEGIARYITAGMTEGKRRFALVTEYIEGQTLENLVQPGKDFAGKRFTEQEAKAFLQQALERIGAFHQRGIIHRDIKPSNILIASDATVYFPDLGLVCDASRSTMTATIAGSPDYVAPEQISKKPVPASDIYSLGMVMWTLMKRERPDIPLYKIFQFDTQDLDFNELIPMGYSRDFVDIVEKMCQKNCAYRYGSIDEVLRDLDVGHVTFPILKPDKQTLQKKAVDAITTYVSALWETMKSIWHAIPYASLSTGQYGVKIALRNKAENFAGLGVGLWDAALDTSKGISFASYKNAIEKDAYGLQLAGLFNGADNAYGLQLAGLFNGANNAYGLQLAGLFNGANNAYGLQLAVCGNGAEHAYGLQLAVCGMNWVEHDMHGLQLAGLFNGADNAYGLQLAGSMNGANYAYGLQLASGMNLAGNAYGVQIGSVNFSLDELIGVQTGLVCYANHGKYLQFGLLTVRGNQGYKSLIPITGWSPLIGWRWEKKEK